MLAIYDYETTSKNPKLTMLTQISCIMLDARSLEYITGGVFNSEVCPIFDDDEAIKAGYEPVQAEALKVTKKSKENLLLAPPVETVWPDFVNFLNRYNSGKGVWGKPIPGGYNITNFDAIITERMCQKFGNADSTGRQSIFHPIHSLDLMLDFYRFTENVKINNNNSLSLDSIREWLGMDKSGAHNSLMDVQDCCELIKRMTNKYRTFYGKTKFSGSLAEWQRPTL